MKKIILLPVLAIAMIMVSCSKSSSDDNSGTNPEVSKSISTGEWTVAEYMDSGKDETSDFYSVKVNFNADGTIIVATSAENYSGTWLLSNGNSSSSSGDDSSTRLIINIAGNRLMEKLSKKWMVEKITNSEIWLRDDNPASMEYIRFTR